MAPSPWRCRAGGGRLRGAKTERQMRPRGSTVPEPGKGASSGAFSFSGSDAMTTKQIALNVGREERAVRNWVKSLAAKNAVVAEKLAASSPAYPADYNLPETCSIIEEGLGKAAADVYRTNAANAEKDRIAARSTLPAAAFVRELRLTYGPEEAARRLDFLLGYQALPSSTPSAPLALPAPARPRAPRRVAAAPARPMKDYRDGMKRVHNAVRGASKTIDLPRVLGISAEDVAHHARKKGLPVSTRYPEDMAERIVRSYWS